MRLLGLTLTAILLGVPLGAQPAQPSAPGTPTSSSGDVGGRPQGAADLPVSLHRIREQLAQGKAESLRGLDERPTFYVQISEQQKIDELMATMKFDAGPVVPGGLYGYEQQQRLWSKTDHPEMQPFGAFSQGELLTLIAENVGGRYLARRIATSIENLRRSEAEAAAREEVARALAEFWAWQASHTSK